MTIQDALKTLNRHKRFVDNTLVALQQQNPTTVETLDSQYLKKIADELNDEIRRVHQRELRMSIVASMKSGKSTIVNALIGENILPARAHAMTIIPTEVIFKRKITQSVLLLSDDIINAINAIYKIVRERLLFLDGAKEGDTIELFENESHLNTLASSIKTDCAMTPLENQILGPINIQATLLFINDLIRLYMKLSANESLDVEDIILQVFRHQIPRIETPFFDVSNTCNLENLVIVDTPGPNEAHLCKELEEIVSIELRKSDVILAVFNYTTLNTEADTKIMEEIADMRNIHGNSDCCLYAIVNKADQRRKGDMTKDDVRKFISTKYRIEEGLTTDDNTRRIFETKAVFGLTAKRFLIEYEQLKMKNVQIIRQDMKTCDDLGSELYASNWEMQQNTITLEQLREGALSMWKMSGLDELLQSIVDSLMNRISSRIAESALTKCKRIGHELVKYLTRRQEIINSDQNRWNTEKIELEGKMRRIEGIHVQQDTYLVPLLNSINNEFETIKCRYSSMNAIQSVSEQSTLDAKRHDSMKIALTTGFLVGATTILGGLTAGFSAAPVLLIGLPALGIAGFHGYNKFWNSIPESMELSFESTSNEFLEVIKMINAIRNDMSIDIKDYINSHCTRLSEDMYNKLSVATSDILEQIQQVLNVPIEIRRASIAPFNIEINDITANDIHLHDRPGIFYCNNKLYISRDELRKQCDAILDKNFAHIKGEIEDWSHNSLQNAFSSYLNELKGYLNKYKEYIQSSLQLQNSNKIEKDKYQRVLQDLIDDLKKEL